MKIISLFWLLISLSLFPSVHAENITNVEESLQQGDFDGAVAATLSEQESPLSQLVIRSRELDLAGKPMWRALMHYQEKGQGWESQIDAPYYFLSDQGKNNPQWELEATLAAMLSQTVKKPMRLTPACRFVARRQWLAESLGELGELIPQPECPEFKRYKKFFAADTLTVIFPSAHPNNPSSAFGHTLLRLDKKDQDPELRMLNQSLNFAAEVPENVSPVTYAAAGIGGGFKGRFHILPYHIKLREYGQVDNRDIWEYTLDLSPQQVEWILTHSYEMLIAWFDYYFFRENCSYHLLSLLDVAYPEKRLTEEFNLWAIPVDTIKVLEENELIRERHYNGSLAKKIKVKQKTLEPTKISQIMDESDADISELPFKEQANLLDLVSDYYRYHRLSGGGSVTRLSDSERQLLKKRSKIPVITEDVVLKTPEYSPDQGHGTSRLSLAYSENQGEKQSSVQFRPAYHDFLDPTPGYGDNTAIDFGSITLAKAEGGATFLKEFIVLDIQSVEPRDRFFKPISWRTRVAFNKDNSEQAMRFELLGGAGFAYRSADKLPVGYLFAETSLIRDRDLEEKTTIGGKIRSGILWEPVSGFRFTGELGFQRDFLNETESWVAEIGSGISLTTNWALTASVESTGENLDELETNPSAAVRYYF